MRRAVLIAALAALALPGAAQAQAPPLRAKLAACLSGPQAGDRTAVFSGSMPAIKGTKRMWMRFDLLASGRPADDFAALKVPGLGIWQKSVPGRAAGFVFTQRVQALVAPGTYMAVVRFRWYGAGGRLLRSTRRATSVCKQPDQRADLHAGLLTAVTGPSRDQATYSLVVANNGRGQAGPFDVLLDVGGVDQPAQRLADGLEAGAKRTLTFVAGRCAPGSSVRFTLDPREEVDEVDEVKNVTERACPLVA
jgi:CARDB protein